MWHHDDAFCHWHTRADTRLTRGGEGASQPQPPVCTITYAHPESTEKTRAHSCTGREEGEAPTHHGDRLTTRPGDNACTRTPIHTPKNMCTFCWRANSRAGKFTHVRETSKNACCRGRYGNWAALRLWTTKDAAGALRRRLLDWLTRPRPCRICVGLEPSCFCSRARAAHCFRRSAGTNRHRWRAVGRGERHVGHHHPGDGARRPGL